MLLFKNSFYSCRWKYSNTLTFLSKHFTGILCVLWGIRIFTETFYEYITRIARYSNTRINLCCSMCNTLCVPYETFRNFIDTAERFSHRDYIGKVWNKCERIRRNCNIFGTHMYFAEITKVVKQSITRYINEPRYSIRSYLNGYYML